MFSFVSGNTINIPVFFFFFSLRQILFFRDNPSCFCLLRLSHRHLVRWRVGVATAEKLCHELDVMEMLVQHIFGPCAHLPVTRPIQIPPLSLPLPEHEAHPRRTQPSRSLLEHASQSSVQDCDVAEPLLSE